MAESLSFTTIQRGWFHSTLPEKLPSLSFSDLSELRTLRDPCSLVLPLNLSFLVITSLWIRHCCLFSDIGATVTWPANGVTPTHILPAQCHSNLLNTALTLFPWCKSFSISWYTPRYNLISNSVNFTIFLYLFIHLFFAIPLPKKPIAVSHPWAWCFPCRAYPFFFFHLSKVRVTLISPEGFPNPSQCEMGVPPCEWNNPAGDWISGLVKWASHTSISQKLQSNVITSRGAFWAGPIQK